MKVYSTNLDSKQKTTQASTQIKSNNANSPNEKVDFNQLSRSSNQNNSQDKKFIKKSQEKNLLDQKEFLNNESSNSVESRIVKFICPIICDIKL